MSLLKALILNSLPSSWSSRSQNHSCAPHLHSSELEVLLGFGTSLLLGRQRLLLNSSASSKQLLVPPSHLTLLTRDTWVLFISINHRTSQLSYVDVGTYHTCKSPCRYPPMHKVAYSFPDPDTRITIWMSSWPFSPLFPLKHTCTMEVQSVLTFCHFSNGNHVYLSWGMPDSLCNIFGNNDFQGNLITVDA